MNNCYIFGSLSVNSFNHTIDETDYVIAADKGLENTEKFDIIPNLIIGDFDSLQYTPQGDNVIQHPVMKDDTDLFLAVRYGLQKGYKNFYIYGCLGERLDHTYGSIQTAAYIKDNGGCAFFVSDDTFLTIIENESISFSDKCNGVISVFSYTESAEISISGLLYGLNNRTIYQSHPLGISNEFINKKSTITVYSGKLLIISNSDTINNILGE